MCPTHLVKPEGILVSSVGICGPTPVIWHEMEMDYHAFAVEKPWPWHGFPRLIKTFTWYQYFPVSLGAQPISLVARGFYADLGVSEDIQGLARYVESK